MQCIYHEILMISNSYKNIYLENLNKKDILKEKKQPEITQNVSVKKLIHFFESKNKKDFGIHVLKSDTKKKNNINNNTNKDRNMKNVEDFL